MKLPILASASFRSHRGHFALLLAVGVLVLAGRSASAQNTDYNTFGVGNAYYDAQRAISPQAQILWTDGNEVTSCAYYDERGQEIQVLNAGDGSYNTNYASTHFDAAPYAVDGRAITGNSDYIWSSSRNVGTVGRWSRSSRQPAGTITVTQDPAGYIGGVVASGGILFVSVPNANTVCIYDTGDGNSAGNYLGQFQATDPNQMAVDSQGNIWVAQRNSPVLVLYSWDGTVRGNITLPGNSSISQIAIYSADGQDHLLVADRGSDLDVKVYSYDPTNPGAGISSSGQIGTPGGVFAGDQTAGLVNPSHFTDVKGVCCDAQGNVYVLTQNFGATESVGAGNISNYSGGATIFRFNRNGTTSWNLAWQDVALQFEGAGEVDAGTLGRGDGTVDIYTGGELYQFNPSDGGSHYYATLINPFKYPNDPRLGANDFAFIRRDSNGGRILFATTQNPGLDYDNYPFGDPINVFVFNPDDGTVASPYTTLDPYVGVYIAANCDVYGVRDNRIYYRHFSGTASNPSWDPEQSWVFNVSGFTSLERCVFDGNYLYVTAFSDQYGGGDGAQGLAGRILLRLSFDGNNWNEEARTLIRYQNDSGILNAGKALTQAGDYLFVGYYNNFGGPAETLAFPKNFGNNPDGVLNATVDFTSSNSSVYEGNDLDSYYGTTAVGDSNNGYIIIKDDYNDGKLVPYTWRP